MSIVACQLPDGTHFPCNCVLMLLSRSVAATAAKAAPAAKAATAAGCRIQGSQGRVQGSCSYC